MLKYYNPTKKRKEMKNLRKNLMFVETPADGASGVVVPADDAAKNKVETKADNDEPFSPKQQERVNKMIQERLETAARNAEAKVSKTTEDRVKELEERALNAEIRSNLTNVTNPTLVAKMIKIEFPDLDSSNSEKVTEAITSFLAANPELIKAESTAPVVKALPGSNKGVNDSLAASKDLSKVDMDRFANDEKYRAEMLAVAAKEIDG